MNILSEALCRTLFLPAYADEKKLLYIKRLGANQKKATKRKNLFIFTKNPTKIKKLQDLINVFLSIDYRSDYHFF